MCFGSVHTSDWVGRSLNWRDFKLAKDSASKNIERVLDEGGSSKLPLRLVMSDSGSKLCMILIVDFNYFV